MVHGAVVLAAVGLLGGAAPMAPDPCALRHRLQESAQLLLSDAEALAGRDRACLLVVAALALQREGKTEQAAEQLRWAASQLPEIAPELAVRAERVTTPPLASDAAPVTPDAAAARVMRLIGEAKPHEAAALALSFPRPANQHDALEVATVTALVRAERAAEALARADALVATDATRKVRAWALSKAERNADADAAYGAWAQATADPALRAEALFYQAFTAWEANALERAGALFQAALDPVRGTPFEVNTRWYLALCLIVADKPAAALPVLRALVAEFPADKEARKHRYWLARTVVDGTERDQLLRALMAEDATDWYGLLSRARLKLPALKGRAIADDAILRLARDDDHARKARLLRGLGLDAEAVAAARVTDPALADVALAQSLGDWFYGYRRGPGFLPFPRVRDGALVRSAGWRASYAVPWRPAALAAGAAAHIPVSFLYAIARTESGFDPQAVSVAGARGATQLLPSVARAACKLRGRPVTDAERLFEPEISLELGATILGLHQQELGSLLLAAAAYNGAPQNVVRWMKSFGALEVELFVERIPFRETRDYVKKVLPTEALYRGLDGGDVTLALPNAIGAPPPHVTTVPPDR